MLNQVVVIGGGVIGLTCALRLRQAGLDVVLLDAGGPASPASFGNAGHIAIEQTRPLASPESVRSAPKRLFAVGGALDFRLRDIGAWARWAPRYLAVSTSERASAGERALGSLLASALPAWRRLAADLGAPELLIEEGHLIAWETASSAEAGLAHWTNADIGQALVHPLTSGEVDALSRLTKATIAGAARVLNTAQISDPNLMMQALDKSFRSLSGERRGIRVTGLRRVEQGFEIVFANGEVMHSPRVLVAAGVGSGGLLEGLGPAAPVIAERGYHVEGPLDEDAVAWRNTPPVVFEDRSLIVTRFGDRLRASGFVEFGRENSAPDKRKWARLKRHCAELRLPMRAPLVEWMGARPTLPDYLPAIGTGEGGLVYAFGHQHLGLTLAALTGELVADLATGRDTPIDLAPFDLNRFARRKPSRMERRS
ncbi:MAG: NAD(P)/FAD-dependent oxidoreductase [Caulobacteraceae bacterium]